MRPGTSLEASARLMRIVGWGVLIGFPFAIFLFPPGFLWGHHPHHAPFIGPAHPSSHMDGLSPYVYMVLVLYIAWAILLVRGAPDPKAAASLFDWGVLANALHGLVMVVMSFTYMHEHAHLWGDVPAVFVVSFAMWYWHPNRVPAEPGGAGVPSSTRPRET